MIILQEKILYKLETDYIIKYVFSLCSGNIQFFINWAYENYRATFVAYDRKLYILYICNL